MHWWRSLSIVLLLVLGVVAAPASVVPGPPRYVGFNVDQQAVRPGEDLHVTVWGDDAVLELRRVSPERPDDAGVVERTRTVVVGNEPSSAVFERVAAGLYRLVVRAAGSDAEQGRAVVQVTDLGVVLHRGPAGALAWVVRLDDGTPVADAEVRLDGEAVGRTDADGTLRLPRAGTVVAEKDGQAAMVTSSPWHVEEDAKVWVHTDRPLYRPGQSVHLKAVAWERVEGLFLPHADAPLSVRVTSYSQGRERALFDGNATTGDYGEADFSFALPDEAPIGRYAVQVRTPRGVHHGSFEVAEYRLPDFHVTVAPSGTDTAVGDAVEVLVHARRYDGGAVGPADLRYEVEGGYGGYGGYGYGGYGYGGSGGSGRHGLVGPGWGSTSGWCDGCGDYRAEGTVALGEDGVARLRLRPDAPGTYVLRLAVEAATGERVEAESVLRVEPAALRVEVLAPWSVSPNATVEADVRVRDLGGRLADATVTVRALVEEWVRATPSGVSGGAPVDDAARRGGFLDVAWTRQERVLWEGEVAAQGGVAHVAFPSGPPTNGQVRVVATVEDGQGRAASSTAYVNLHGGAGAGSPTMALHPLDPSPAVGDPLHFAVRARGDAPVLVVVEDGGTLAHQVVDPRTEATAAFSGLSPTSAVAYASAVQVVGAAPGLLPTLEAAQASVTWRDHPMGLRVEVRPDFDVYEDGQTARLLVRVQDAAGRPVQAQLSIVMVDRALLDLARGAGAGGVGGAGSAGGGAGGGAAVDALASLLYPPGSGSSTASWQRAYGGWGGSMRLLAFDGDFLADAAPGAVTFASASAPSPTPSTSSAPTAPPSAPAVRVREVFPETALWLPRVETGEDGVARVEAALPDSLTDWSVVAHAVAQDGKVGGGEGSLRTRKALAADLLGPRFTVAGDEASVQATVSNQVGATVDVHVVLEAAGADLLGDAGRTLTLAPDATGLVTFRFATPLAGDVALTLTAWVEDGPADAVRVRFPVLPHGVQSGVTRAGEGEADVTIVVPQTAAQNASRLLVTVSPSTTDAVTQALPFLTGYPYGCVEQTLSTFLPLLAVAEAAAAYGIDKDDIDPELDEQVAAGLERLYGYQHGSGAWGWWHNDADNPYTTAYVVYGLALARDAGYEVRPDVLARGVAELARMARASEGALHAYQTYAIALADPSLVEGVPGGDGSPELAFGALVAQALGDDGRAEELAQQLAEKARRSGGTASWRDTGEGWTTHGITSDTMLTAVALRALLAVDPDHPVAHEAARGLLQGREGRAWATTKDTAETILSLVAYVRAQGQGDDERTVTVEAAGERHVLRFTRDGAWTLQDPIEVPVGPGTHVVTIRQEGDGPLFWSVAGRWFDGAEEVPARAGAFEVERRLVDEDGRAVDRLRVGEEAFLEVVVRATEDTRYMQVEAPIPAGVEVVDEGEPMFWTMDRLCLGCGGWSSAEVRDEKVGFFEDQFPAGSERNFRVRVRALLPGHYHVLPAVAQEMYDADARGHSASSTLEVLPRAQLQVGRVALDAEAGRVRVEVFPVGFGSDRAPQISVHADGEEVPGAVDAERTTTPGGASAWVVEAPAPAGAFEVRLRAGEARATVRVDPLAQPEPPQAQFNETHEAAWRDGPVQVVHSTLRQVLPDLRPRLPEDPLPDPDAQVARRVPGPGLPLAVLLLGALALRRRAGAGRHGAA